MKNVYFNLSSRQLPLTVDSIGNHWTQENVIRPKGYPRYHWLQTEQGSGAAVIDGKQLTLPEGTGVLIAPSVPHAYHSEQGEWLTSFVTFSGKLEADIRKIVGDERYIFVNSATDFSFLDWIDRTITLHESGQTDPIQLSTGCYAFLMHISSFRNYQEYQSHPLYQRYVAPAIKEIETQYCQEITTQELADAVYVSPQYLSRLFKRFLGCSTYAYLTNYRLTKARELLVNRPDLAVSQIGARTGYHDASHFIAIFKSAAGCTPFEFRQLHGSSNHSYRAPSALS